MTSFSATLKLGVGGGVGCCITAAHKWQAHVQSHVLNLLAKYFPPTVWKHFKKAKKGEGSNKFPFSDHFFIFWSKKVPFWDQKTFQIPRHRTVPQKWLSPSLWVSGSSGLWVSGFLGLRVSGSLGLWVFRSIIGPKKNIWRRGEPSLNKSFFSSQLFFSRGF